MLLWTRSQPPLPEPTPHSTPAALAGRWDLPVLVPRRHGQSHVSRAGRSATGPVYCCDTVTSHHVHVWAPPSARSGADGAPVSLLSVGEAECVGVVRVGYAIVLAGRPFTLGAPLASGGEIKAHGGPPAPRAGVRHAGLGRVKGGVQGRAAARGGRGHGPPEWRCPAGSGG